MEKQTLPPIATLTLNPCLDVSYEFESLVPDQKVRAAEEGRRLQRGGVTYVCVPLSGEGAILVGPEKAYHAAEPPRYRYVPPWGRGMPWSAGWSLPLPGTRPRPTPCAWRFAVAAARPKNPAQGSLPARIYSA